MELEIIDKNGIETLARAIAFEKLTKHLQQNPSVQNIDIMGLAGFCRNCLAKWLVISMHELGEWGYSYDEALNHIYGMSYDAYKKAYQTKATADQLDKFNATKNMHAKHDPNFLQTKPNFEGPRKNISTSKTGKPAPALSDVCCEKPGALLSSETEAVNYALKSELPRVAGVDKRVSIRLGVVTVSDRAYAGKYMDESGPKIVKCFSMFAARSGSVEIVTETKTSLINDDPGMISDCLISLSDNDMCNLIITTGGTGLSPRDNTPEATLAVVQREVRGIPELIRRETSKFEPKAVLSRAVAGIRRSSCLIVNLPGRPKACLEALAVLLPIIGFAVRELNAE